MLSIASILNDDPPSSSVLPSGVTVLNQTEQADVQNQKIPDALVRTYCPPPDTGQSTYGSVSQQHVSQQHEYHISRSPQSQTPPRPSASTPMPLNPLNAPTIPSSGSTTAQQTCMTIATTDPKIAEKKERHKLIARASQRRKEKRRKNLEKQVEILTEENRRLRSALTRAGISLDATVSEVRSSQPIGSPKQLLQLGSQSLVARPPTLTTHIAQEHAVNNAARGRCIFCDRSVSFAQADDHKKICLGKKRRMDISYSTLFCEILIKNSYTLAAREWALDGMTSNEILQMHEGDPLMPLAQEFVRVRQLARDGQATQFEAYMPDLNLIGAWKDAGGDFVLKAELVSLSTREQFETARDDCEWLPWQKGATMPERIATSGHKFAKR
ncbi:hypothetical protein B0T10DRAFT_467146 [Thelonectria olida]|uniref:BZIP domain-containing protein n=1 Tax=Thelonectria olida TaxID=1576542 RepID=A0A9P8VPQ7_9HYPO|nr:hypothetical protein B0T10DRAFT_467146 [Thelonectria olida]